MRQLINRQLSFLFFCSVLCLPLPFCNALSRSRKWCIYVDCRRQTQTIQLLRAGTLGTMYPLHKQSVKDLKGQISIATNATPCLFQFISSSKWCVNVSQNSQANNLMFERFLFLFSVFGFCTLCCFDVTLRSRCP